MYFIDTKLVQGSDAWLAWRRGVIGASDAPTIMGENPWKSSDHLKNEKLGLVREFTGNFFTREGQRLEPIARKATIELIGVTVKPAIVQDEESPYIAASLDGINSEESLIVEIKCGLKSYEYLAKYGRIPSYYFAQLQHILLITGYRSMLYVAFRPNERLRIVEVKRDAKYLRNLRRTEELFVEELEAHGHKFANKHRGKLSE